MVEYSEFELENGLRVIHCEDKSTPMVAVNVLYDVGARDEVENKTGFAHLFEHLMFGGSVNIPEFDKPLQLAGGQSNAFTSNDITNYYDTLPADNLDVALWLESDRMLSLAFTPKSLEVQRSVVIEEFKQRYINQPYGDVWHLIRKKAYTVHPYKWPTIGKELSHIEDATMDDVRAFFEKHYSPQNAILCVVGNVSLEQTRDRVNFWFKDLPAREKYLRELPLEPEQNELRIIEHEADVPTNAFYMAFKMGKRTDPNYPAVDLISDLLGRGKSSRLHAKLVHEYDLLSSVSCFVMGSFDEGMLIITGMLKPESEFNEVEKRIWDVLVELNKNGVEEQELKKVFNKFESAKMFGETNVLNKAMNLSYFKLLGDIELINTEINAYERVTPEQILKASKHLFRESNCTLLRYHRK